MLDINSLVDDSPIAPEKPITPGINIIEVTDTYGKFHIEPLERGYGATPVSYTHLTLPTKRIV